MKIAVVNSLFMAVEINMVDKNRPLARYGLRLTRYQIEICACINELSYPLKYALKF